MVKATKMTLLFFLKKGVISKVGKSPIMGRITIGRTMVQFSCKCSCTPALWDSRKNRLLGKSAEAVEVNRSLDQLQLSIYKVYDNLCSNTSEDVTAHRVRELVFGLNSYSQGILYHYNAYIAQFRERVGIDRSERRLKCLKVGCKHLSRFIQYRYRVEDYPAQRVDQTFLQEYEQYFTVELSFKVNTTAGYLSMFASVLKELHKQKVIDTYPFLNYSIRWDVGTPRYITKAELQKIADLDYTQLQEYEIVSRDMFLFSCYTGLSYTDVYHLTREHIIEESDITWIRKPRQKTDKVCHIPLFPEALEIINLYSGIHTKAFKHEPPKGYLLPIPGADTVNIHLKKIARLCGIEKRLTFHMARHTFASQMTLSEGVSIESVSKMLGHGELSTTQIYAELSPERVFSDLEQILPHLEQYQLTN